MKILDVRTTKKAYFLKTIVIAFALFLTYVGFASAGKKVKGVVPVMLLLDSGMVVITEDDADAEVTFDGEQRVWHAITLDVQGPQSSETATPNPFKDYRLEVVFENGNQRFVVPGFFAADGNAGATSAASGNIWRTRFSPNIAGTWNYTYRFFRGNNVAINGGGSPVSGINGINGQFSVAASDKTGRDFRGKGRLQYVGQRYLRHAGNGEYFLKVGADAPEGLLGYADFDNTRNQNNSDPDRLIKTYDRHVADWNTGDPTWKNGKGKGLIGALNYLAEEGQNAFSFLTYSVDGDSKTVWPFVSPFQRLNYDVSKLAQWDIIFSHADKMGLYLHFKLQETENDNGNKGLDLGNVGIERKLYYRELIARFGHHLALNWNLGEENSQTTLQQRQMAQYFFDTDPYKNHIVIHTFPGQQERVYRPLLGNNSRLTGASVQTGYGDVHRRTLQWINESSNSNSARVWVVANDEQGNANIGVPPDIGYKENDNSTPYQGVSVSQYNIRHETLWGNLMAGGAGVEYYFGYQQPCTDLTCEDYRSRDKMWDYNRYALQFFKDNLPFAQMVNRNDLIGNGNNSDNDGYCLAKVGDVYAVYLNDNERVSLNLAGIAGNFSVKWFNPRTGGNLVNGSVTNILGGGTRALGNPPDTTDDPEEDWVVLIKKL